MKMKPALIALLVEDHYENLYRFAFILTKNKEEAADLTQQTYLCLAEKGGQFKHQSKAKSWLFTNLRREFYSIRKQTGRFDPMTEKEFLEVESPEDVDREVLKRANRALILEGLSEIQEVFRIPLALYYLEDFNYREIAGILDIPEGTVTSRIHHGRVELRIWLLPRLKSGGAPEM